MTSKPSVLYWQPGTIALLHALRGWREEGGPAGFFTMDAGPNVHVIAQRKDAAALQAKILAVAGVQETILCGIGRGARIIDDDLHPYGFESERIETNGQ
jgi:diphosphomevalonate decarboxylase